MVELPSKPQLGRSARLGGCSNSLSRLLPRRPGTGCLPSSQMYSSLYFVISYVEDQWVLVQVIQTPVAAPNSLRQGSPESHKIILDVYPVASPSDRSSM